MSMQTLVAFTFYEESIALAPQLWVMQRLRDIDGLARPYMLLIVGSRLLRLLFWGSLLVKGELFPGLMIADVVHTVICARYVVTWWSNCASAHLPIQQHRWNADLKV